jgi:hypothetical protein
VRPLSNTHRAQERAAEFVSSPALAFTCSAQSQEAQYASM